MRLSQTPVTSPESGKCLHIALYVLYESCGRIKKLHGQFPAIGTPKILQRAYSAHVLSFISLILCMRVYARAFKCKCMCARKKCVSEY